MSRTDLDAMLRLHVQREGPNEQSRAELIHMMPLIVDGSNNAGGTHAFN